MDQSRRMRAATIRIIPDGPLLRIINETRPATTGPHHRWRAIFANFDDGDTEIHVYAAGVQEARAQARATLAEAARRRPLAVGHPRDYVEQHIELAEEEIL